MTTQAGYRIGELAQATGFPLTTLRYYEDRGIIPAPERTAAGHRRYGEEHRQRLVLVARAKRLGLSLDEAVVLADAWQHHECAITHEQLLALLETKLSDVRTHIAELTAFARQLETVYEQVADRAPAHDQCGPACGCAPALAGHAPPDSAPVPFGEDTPPAASYH